MKCRHCSSEVSLNFADLGSAPPSNAYLSASSLQAPEQTFPLVVMVCENCWLVQTQDFSAADELFSEDYAYFSSFSDSWLAHSKQYVEKMIERFALDETHRVIEVASNDGYLLQFVKERGIPCIGIEPTASTAHAAKEKGIETIEEFFGAELGNTLAKAGKAADLTIANNVLAHVPDINDFLAGFAAILTPHGVSTFEFPHLLQLVQKNQFDTIYHEHYSYLSLTALKTVFSANGLTIFDVETLPTHGGSLRVFAQRSDTGSRPQSSTIDAVMQQELDGGLNEAAAYRDFQRAAETVKDDFVHFLIDAKRKGSSVAAYGAAAKGNTLMNFGGCRSDLIRYVVDRNPNKQEMFMPGSRIPIVAEDVLLVDKPDYIVILPWNLTPEIISQLSYVKEWGGKFVTAVPKLQIHE